MLRPSALAGGALAERRPRCCWWGVQESEAERKVRAHEWEQHWAAIQQRVEVATRESEAKRTELRFRLEVRPAGRHEVTHRTQPLHAAAILCTQAMS
jgi:hypothetical protein